MGSGGVLLVESLGDMEGVYFMGLCDLFRLFVSLRCALSS